MGIWVKKIINALNIIKPPFNVNELHKGNHESLKDNKFISKSIKHNIFAYKIERFLNNYDISSNKVSANFYYWTLRNVNLKRNIL